jgi:predicted GNAT family N-acyltransferase
LGFVFAFDLNGERIGTIRIVPMGHGLTLTETLLPELSAVAPKVGLEDWEVGRLVLAPEFRADVDALRHCLYLALEYTRQHTQVGTLYAACTHVLSRLYRRFSFNAFARDVPLRGTPKTYTMISGPFDEVGRALATRPAMTAQ